MAKTIDFIFLSENEPGYDYTMEVFDEGKPTGGCRTKNKDDLKAMYNLWKETYGTMFLKYIFKKGDKVITL